jgi:hypothetical protein
MRADLTRQRAHGISVLGYLADKKQPPPLGPLIRALGIFLLQGPRGALFLMSEVPLYRAARLPALENSFCLVSTGVLTDSIVTLHPKAQGVSISQTLGARLAVFKIEAPGP